MEQQAQRLSIMYDELVWPLPSSFFHVVELLLQASEGEKI